MSRKDPTAWQNFWWDVDDWICHHGWFFALVLLIILGMQMLVAPADAETLESMPGYQCFSPFAPEAVPEFELQNVGITVHWFDTVEALRDDIGELEDERIHAASECETKPEFNISYCDVYLVRPGAVDDDATLSLGHEILHGLWGTYHAE